MSHSTLAAIIVPAVALIALAVWISLVYRADRHPGPAGGSRGFAARSAAGPSRAAAAARSRRGGTPRRRKQPSTNRTRKPAVPAEAGPAHPGPGSPWQRLGWLARNLLSAMPT
jgi:hypothetical protein